MNRGRLVSFEGGEGCGKSTQARLLAVWLEEQGVPVVLTREPGGTAGAEAIRQLLLEPPGESWNAAAEALLFAAARSDHVAQVILPALTQGRWVVCDRFIDSSLAYQGIAGQLGLEAVRTFHNLGSFDLLPDLTILLNLDHTTAAARLEQRDKGAVDAIGGRGVAYHQRVYNAFVALAEAEPDRFVVLDASATIEEVQEQVRAAVRPLFEQQLR